MTDGKILIVEDEIIVARSIEGKVEALGYSSVGTVTTGEEAIKAALREEPDLVLMDIRLGGGMDGTEAADRIRSELDIPVVYLTAFDDEATIKRASVTGPFGFIVKPFVTGELHASIEIALMKHGMDRKLRESEEKYRSLFENARSGIVLIEVETGGIVDFNPEFEVQTGRGREELRGMRIWDLRGPAKVDLAKMKFEEIVSTGTGRSSYLEITRPDGTTIDIEFVASKISIGGRDYLQSIVTDISEQKQMEREMLRKLSHYVIDSGETYLVLEREPLMSTKAFQEMLSAGFDGLLISRRARKDFRELRDLDLDYRWIAENGVDSVPPDRGAIMGLIENIRPRSIVLIVQLDYLRTKIGSVELINLVHSIREQTAMKGLITIISADRKVLTDRELRSLWKECKPLEPRQRGNLSGDLQDVLRFVYEENLVGVKPSYTIVGENLKISKPTVRKRIRRLNSMGYLKESSKGRTKVIEVTDRGRSYFDR